MSGYVLYGYPGSGSAAIEVAMVEAAIPVTFHTLDHEAGELEAEAFRAINPRGQVPALVHPDGEVITEVPAILNHLADAHPGCGLAPPPGTPARARHDRWMAFLHANLYEAILRFYYTERYTTDPATIEPVREAARAYIIRHFGLFAEAIDPGPFTFGADPQGVDFLAWALSTWIAPEDIAALDPRITTLAEAMRTRSRLTEVVTRNL